MFAQNVVRSSADAESNQYTWARELHRKALIESFYFGEVYRVDDGKILRTSHVFRL